MTRLNVSVLRGSIRSKERSSPMTNENAESAFHRAIAEAHNKYADALAKLSPSVPVPGGAKPMSQTTAWYAKHGSVLKKVHEAGGVVTSPVFHTFAEEAGYTAGSRGQLYRKD